MRYISGERLDEICPSPRTALVRQQGRRVVSDRAEVTPENLVSAVSHQDHLQSSHRNGLVDDVVSGPRPDAALAAAEELLPAATSD